MTVPIFWREAKQHLSGADDVMARIVAAYPDEMLQKRGDAFFTLLRSITGQQISVKAADAVWGRFEALVAPLTPKMLLSLSEDELRGCGLSRQKVSYVRAIAEGFASKSLQPERWPEMEDEAVLKELVAIKGIGRWTAEMFLLFQLHRPDVLPLGDLGLVKAMQLHYAGGEALDKAALQKIAEPWRPFRSVATWYLWRSLDPVPVEY